jgi:hypothetical protein
VLAIVPIASLVAAVLDLLAARTYRVEHTRVEKADSSRGVRVAGGVPRPSP